MNAITGLRELILAQPERKRPATLVDELLIRYNDEQIAHWESMLAQSYGNPDIRQSEVKLYLACHRDIRNKHHRWEDIDNFQKSEILDCYAEEFGG